MKVSLIIFLLSAVTIVSGKHIDTTICHRKIDLLFMIDVSNSISDADFQKQIKFTKDVAGKFDIGGADDETQVAVIGYDYNVYAYLYFSRGVTGNSLKTLDNIKRTSGTETNIYSALLIAMWRMFNSQWGARSSAKRIMILISDGVTQAREEAMRYAKLLKQNDIHIFTIRVGQTTAQSRNNMRDIASEPKGSYHYAINNYAGLHNILSGLTDYACPDAIDCDTQNGGCQHLCEIKSTGGRQCYCRPGYTLDADDTSCNNIDECSASPNPCQHTCSDTDGSYTCSCNAGYDLNLDQKTCKLTCTKSIDLVFILDSSKSVNKDGFAKQIEFVTDLTKQLSIGQGTTQTRVGVIIYHTNVTVAIKLDEARNMYELRQKLLTFEYSGGNTYTFDALRTAREQVFKNARPTASKVAIILTDGKSQNTDKTKRQATLLKNKQVTLYAIGIGNKNTARLRGIATSNKHVLEVTDFGKLSTTIKQLKKENC